MYVFIFFFIGVGAVILFFFFFQAEDGIRDYKVTGVQTCALPISCAVRRDSSDYQSSARKRGQRSSTQARGRRWSGVRNRGLLSSRLAARGSANRRRACHLGGRRVWDGASVELQRAMPSRGSSGGREAISSDPP